MISYDILQVPETGASSSTTPVGRSPRMVPGKAGATKPATAPAPAPDKSKGKAIKLTAAAPAAAAAPARGRTAAAVAPARTLAPAPAPAAAVASAPAAAVASAPVAPAEGAAAAEGGADEDMEALAALEGGNPSGEEPTNQDAKCFFTTFKSGLAPQHFECNFDMATTRECMNGKIHEDDNLMIPMI